MKFHIKTGLTFLLITIILLVGLTAISAADVDNTQTQEIVKHTEVSTTSYDSVSKDVADETVKSDNLNEKEKTIEKVNNKTKTNTNTITKSPAIQSSNAAVKTLDYNGIHWDDNKVVYVNWYNHEHSYSYNWQTQTVTANELGDGSRNNPTSIYNAIKIVPQNGVIVLLHNPDNMTNNNGETVYETRPNAPWVNRGGGANYYPGAPNQYSTIDTFTIIGEPGYTIVWSGKRHNTNMFSLSEMYNATLMNIVFRDGNASGIPSGQQGRNGGTADHGGAIDNRGKLQVINCTFENILANENGGAIANYEKAVTLIENCTFKNITSTNSANFQGDPNEKYGGAISVNKTNGFSQTPQVTVRNSNFTDIEAEYGGVFYNNHGILNVENVIIDGSTATTEGGAIINLNNGVTTLTNVNMSNLEAVDYGGAVANLGGTVNLDNVDINHVVITKTAESEYFGGTIYVAEDATITIKNSHLEDMTATHGAVFNVEGGILTVEDTEIENAIATTFGGLACIQDGHVIMDNVKVNNVCTSVDPNDYQKGNGALFLAEMGTIEVSNSNFTNNKGRAGTIGFFFFAEATFENNNFINNEATGKDNYLIESMYSDTTFKNNYFENNTNNYRDMLSVNETSRSGGYDNPTMEGNTYIDNTLDHTISFKINGVLKTFTSESEIPLITPENPITPVPLINITLNDTDHQTNTTDVELDLRSPYADLEEDGGVKNGTIQILKDDEVLYDNIIVTDSTANIIFDVNDFDTYNTTLTLKYTSDKHFLNKTYLFTVYKITNTTTEVNCDDVPVFDPVDISGTVKDYENVGANGSLIIRFDDPENETYIEFPDGVVDGVYDVFVTPDLPVGEHTVYVQYAGLTDRFNASANSIKFNVLKRNVTLTLDDIDDVTVRDKPTITGIVLDEAEGTPITEGKVRLTITGENGTSFIEEVDVNSDGTFEYPDYIADKSGHYDVVAKYLGTENYNESEEVTKGFNADKIPTTTSLDDLEVITVGDSIVVTGTLTETDSGAAIPGAKLNITVPGLDEPIELTTGEDGKFTTNGVAEIKIENTTMNKITATYAGNDTYVESSDVNDLTVQEAPTNITIDTGDEITAHVPTTAIFTLYDVNGNIAPNGIKDAEVTVTIVDEYGNNLNTTTVITGPDGSITVGYTPVTDGEIIYTAVYNGKTYVFKDCQNETKRDDVQSIDTVISVSADDTVINGTSKITVDLNDANNKPVNNGTIHLEFSDGTPAVDIVIPNGNTNTTFTSEFINTTVGKNVTVTATFVPDEHSGYNSAKGEDDFEVEKLPTTIEIDSGNPVAHNETIATITLKNSTANVPNEPINITIVDKEGNILFNDTVNTTDEGIVKVPYTPVTGSPINITAVFDGNPVENVYIGSNNSIEVTPAMMETKIVLNSTNTIVDGTSTIGVNVTDANGNPVNGTVDLTIKDDKGNEYNVSVPVENGIGNYTYPSENADMGKIVDVTGHYVENKTLGYATSPEAETEFEVAKLNTTVDLVVNNNTITNFTVEITVTGKDTDRTVENGTLIIYANGTKVGEAEVVDGKAENVWLNITEIGDYELTVEYGGNDVFNENNTFATDVTAIKINTTTTVEVVNNTVGNVTLEAVVRDVNGNIVNEGVVNITAVDEEGNEYYIGEAEIVDGKAIIKNETITGNEEYVFTANFEGTPTYNISNGTTTEEIVTRPTTTTIEVLNNTFENVTVKVTVTDDTTGNPISFGDVEITLPNGTVITV
ncbi:hypothetical protein, partial [Methanosphaera sp.]|uniref:hypothetical protein n=1 Tax=Methanosphaera sp. TaxID=2666342 RepID=UPI002E75B58A